MVEQKILTRGGVYLARLDPAKGSEIGKLRPIVILTVQTILEVNPPTVFVCPLSSKSQPEFKSLHTKLLPRDNLHATSYALAEHCRAISNTRVIVPRIAQLSTSEIKSIVLKLQRLIGIT